MAFNKHESHCISTPPFSAGGEYSFQSQIFKGGGDQRKIIAWGTGEVSATDICLEKLTMFFVKKNFLKYNFEGSISNVDLGLC